MSTITKEWLQHAINDYENCRNEPPFGLSDHQEKILVALRIAMASLEAEVVAYVDPQAFNNFSVYRAGETDNKRMSREWMWANPDAGLIPVYTAPPAPVSVPDRSMFEKWWESEHGSPLDSWDSLRTTDGYWDDGIDGQFEAWNACRAAMLQDAEPVTTAYKLREEIGLSLQLRNLIRQRHAEWSQATFGDVGPIGPLKHLSKEALEAAAEPGDLSEWADMQFLLWDAQRRAGISDGEITAAMEEKLKENMARQWPEPKDGEPRMHIKAGGNSPVIPDGWMLVPKEPTPEMLNAAWVSHGIYHASAYRTMLAAAPQLEVKQCT